MTKRTEPTRVLKTCNLCGHRWLSDRRRPVQCPHCRSTRWDYPPEDLPAGSIGKRGRPRKEL